MKQIQRIIGYTVFIVLIGLGFTGCRESVPDTMDLTLRLVQQNSQSRQVEVDPEPTISEFVIRGSGPRNSSFVKNTEADELTVEDIFIGDWSFTVEGKNEGGIVLISGSADRRVIPENPDIYIDLKPAEGDGRLEIYLTWEEHSFDLIFGRVAYRRTDIPDSEPTVRNISSGSSGGQFFYDLPAGDYSLQFEIFEDQAHTEKIGGLLTPVRVFPDSTTTGTLDLDCEIPLTSGGFHLNYCTAPPLDGRIIGAPFIIYEDIPMNLTYAPEVPGAVDKDDLFVEWYINGQIVRSHEGTLETFITPEAGYQRMDVLAYSSRQGSLGSASLEYDALDYELTKDLMLVQTLLDKEGGAFLRSVSDLTVTPQGYVITAARGDSLVQVFEQSIDGTLSPHHTIEQSPSTPLRGARSVTASRDGSYIGVLSEYTPSIGIYEYDTITDRFEHRHTLQEELLPGSLALELPSDIQIASNGRDIYMTDQRSDELHHLHWTGTELRYISSAELSGSPKLCSPRRMSIDPSGKYLALASMNNSSLHIFSADVEGRLERVQAFSYSHTSTMGISRISHVIFADDGTLFTASNDFLCHFGYDDSFSPSYRIHERDFTDCRMSGLRTAVIDELRDRVYVGTVTSRGITVYDRHPDNTLTFRSFTPCAPIHHMAVDSTGSYLYAISTSEHALFVFDIR